MQQAVLQADLFDIPEHLTDGDMVYEPEDQSVVDGILTSMGQTGSVIQQTFRCIEIAEDILSDFKNRYPAQANEIDAAFPYLRPGELFQHLDERIYRSHVKELIERSMVGDDMNLGTKAEMLYVLFQTSLRAPLNQDGAALMGHLFHDVMGEEACEYIKKHTGKAPNEAQEYIPGSIMETITYLSKKLSRKRHCAE